MIETEAKQKLNTWLQSIIKTQIETDLKIINMFIF